MADFKWDDYPEAKADFDWDQFAPTKEMPKTGQLESGLRGLAQGASMGFADEITGGVESLFSDKPYEQARDESRANYQAAQKDNPITYGAGQVGGGLATLAIPGLNVAKGASLAKTAGAAALQGGISGLGFSESEDAAQLAKDAAVGAGIGGALGAGGGYLAGKISGAVPKVAGQLDDAAEYMAARALGAERGTIKSIGRDKVRAAGRYALDEGILSPLASTDDLVARNQAALDRSGSGGRAVREAIDEKSLSNFNPLEVAGKVDEKIGGFWRSPINRGQTNQLENTLESILMRGDKPIPLSEAQILKQELGKVANWKNNLNITDKERMARDAYGVVASSIDDAVEQGAKQLDSPGLLQQLKEANKTYSRASTAEKLLENKAAREEGNKMFGLTDTIVGGTGLISAIPTGGLSVLPTAAALGAKKLGEKYGAQTTAIGLDKLAEVVRASPQTFGKYGSVLQKAAARGGTSLGAAHYVLQNADPEYRKMLEKMHGEQNF